MSAVRMKLGGPLLHTFALVAVAAVFLLITLRFVDVPFVWRYDYPSAHHATYAINHLNYGLEVTKGAQYANGNPQVPEHLFLADHHPPLMPLVIAASYHAFGFEEWAARGVMILFSAVSVLLLYWAVRLLVDKESALFAAVIFALLPLNLVYSTKVNHEPMVLPFVLGCLVAYGYWARRPGTGRFAVLLVVFAIGTMVGWGAYYVGGLLPAFHFVSLWHARKPVARADLAILVMPLVAILMFGAFVGHLYWVDPSSVHGLLNLAAERTGVAVESETSEEAFSNLSLLQRTITRSALLFTLPALALAITGLILALARVAGERRGEYPEGLVLLLFWAVGLTHILVFRHVSWVHEFLVYYLMVPVSVSAGWLLHLAVERLPKRTAVVAILAFSLLFVPIAFLQARDIFWTGQITGILPLSKYLKARVPEGGVVLSTATHHPYLHPGVAHYSRRDVIERVETVERVDQLRAWYRTSPLFLIAFGEPSASAERTAELIRAMDARFEAEETLWGTLYDLSATLGPSAEVASEGREPQAPADAGSSAENPAAP